jgi:hypothetical protein
MSGKEGPPYRYPRLAFVAYCLQRWTVDLVVDLFRLVFPETLTYTVQLHRLVRVGEWPESDKWKIANSWEPIKVRGLRAARTKAHELRQTNRWATLNDRPYVTITNPHGITVSNWEVLG